jgi:hypothetical protein
MISQVTTVPSSSDMPAGEPTAWLSEVALKGASAPVRVIFVRREGHNVIVRQIDPGDGTPPRVPLWDGDHIVVMQALSHIGINTNPEVGDVTGFLFGLRIVETRRERGTVYARTLKLGEVDDGSRVHVAPGEQVTLEAGAITVELDYLDSLEEPSESGYVSLTPVLATWYSVGPHDPTKVRYLLAAARRLDEANRRLIDVEQHRKALGDDGLAGPAIRRHVNALIGGVESAVIALGRAVDMVDRARRLIGATPTVPASVTTHKPAITAIRNAYEHIEDRALGLERGHPHPDALTIFDYRRLVEHNAIVYGSHSLGLSDDVPQLLQDARAFFKAVAGTD